ncbi:uncharacterized protein LOC18448520 isoform X1 [Amborella trichopoda]|uniref:Gem-associated protein 2 n=1 Tax=Amborella trichopoda TaxID=13333 RepID=U5DD27_AMBTC|nr:uncharacterized protein LOC18448520 isoform X1 [Amborella trichopoda]ERN20110.1 hypothetical protein AMTR_s00066p00050590 [Amborella trichopoda]|eukprot:XP_006858643.1 uncharacterized protein LOC18448520 isoform X1 [Amborella trichopoda]
MGTQDDKEHQTLTAITIANTNSNQSSSSSSLLNKKEEEFNISLGFQSGCDDGNFNNREIRCDGSDADVIDREKCCDDDIHFCFHGGDGSSRKKYNRDEMQPLQFANKQWQMVRWIEIYTAIPAIVKTELHGLSADASSVSDQGKGRRRDKPKKKKPHLHGDHLQPGRVHFENIEQAYEELHLPEVVSNSLVNGQELDENEDSDIEDNSLLKPAFQVEGDPDFESGPPQDGLEYLRRVRWEAAHIPNVKVANIDERKLKAEQTSYMPNIPDIPSCPNHLLPSKQWEDAFLADFSELRQAISQLEYVGRQPACASNSPLHEENNVPKAAHLLSQILYMDAVTRANLLRQCALVIEEVNSLSRGDCIRLFGIFAAVEKPLDGDTSAAVRGVLRKCASLRASKTECNDEVVMLNLLITIASKYFGQSES